MRSKLLEVVSVAFLAFLTAGIVWLFHGTIVTTSVQLETFAPLSIVEPAGLIVLAVLGALLLSNTFRMYRFTKAAYLPEDPSGQSRQLFSSLTQIVSVLGAYFVTQFPMTKCGARRRWIDHVLTVAGYGTSFVLFVILLRYTLTNQIYSLTNPLLLAGYFTSFALLYGTTISITRRVRRSDTYSRSARHSTDWMFVLLLFFTALTGSLVLLFQYLSMPLATYVAFTVHLSFVVPLLVLEVPFAKWSHLAYRPFAAYFAALRGMKVPRIRGGAIA
jgi:hypothetical protein